MQFTDIDTKIFNLLEATINLLGFDLVKVSLVNDGSKKLKVIIDGKNDAKLTIDDCQSVSKSIAPILDVEDLIHGKYILEVSSAGLERPLVRLNDYIKFSGKHVEVRLHKAIDGCKVYRGVLQHVEDSNIIIQINDKLKVVPLENIKSANLILTEEMFRAILRN